MKRKIFSSISIMLMFTLLLSVAGCGSSGQVTSGSNEATTENGQAASTGEKRTFKLGHIVPESHIVHKSALKFKEELEQRSNGRLSVVIYPNGTVGTEQDMLQQMQSGVLDMGFVTIAELTNSSSSFNAWLMPFVIRDLDHLFQVAESEEAYALLETLEDQGFHGLGYITSGMRHLMMKDKFIESPADLNGMKLRVTPSPVIVDWWKRLNTSPTSIPLPEVYSAFQTGVIDGLDSDLIAINSNKLQEIGKYLTLTYHMAFQNAAMVSKSVWDSLSDEDKKIIEEAFKVAYEFNLEQSKLDETEALAALKNDGVQVKEFEMTPEFQQLKEQFLAEYVQKDEKIQRFIEKAEELAK